MITLKKHLEHLAQFLAEDPSAGDWLVLYANDQNVIKPVKYFPEAGVYENEIFTPIDDPDAEVNAICIN